MRNVSRKRAHDEVEKECLIREILRLRAELHDWHQFFKELLAALALVEKRWRP